MTSATDNRTTELLCCPFCGDEATVGGSIRQHYGEIYRVGCDKKGCAGWRYEGVMYKSRKAAIAAWNTRAERTCRMEYQTEGMQRTWSGRRINSN